MTLRFGAVKTSDCGLSPNSGLRTPESLSVINDGDAVKCIVSKEDAEARMS